MDAKSTERGVVNFDRFAPCFQQWPQFIIPKIIGFEKGWRSEGWRQTNPHKEPRNVLQKCVPLLLMGHRKRVQKRGLNLWHTRDFLAPTLSVRQPLFETSEKRADPYEQRWQFVAKIHANLVFQACISFLRVFVEENLWKCLQVPILFYRRVSCLCGVSDKSGAPPFLDLFAPTCVAHMSPANRLVNSPFFANSALASVGKFRHIPNNSRALGSRARCESAPSWDDEVRPLFIIFCQI